MGGLFFYFLMIEITLKAVRIARHLKKEREYEIICTSGVFHFLFKNLVVVV